MLKEEFTDTTTQKGFYLRDRRDDPLRARKEDGKPGCSACDDNCLRGAV